MQDGDARLAEVGARMKQARRFRGLSAADAAESLGISRSSLALYEAGKRDVRLTVLLGMIELYRVDASWLLGYASEFVAAQPQRRIAYLYEYDQQ